MRRKKNLQDDRVSVARADLTIGHRHRVDTHSAVVYDTVTFPFPLVNLPCSAAYHSPCGSPTQLLIMSKLHIDKKNACVHACVNVCVSECVHR